MMNALPMHPTDAKPVQTTGGGTTPQGSTQQDGRSKFARIKSNRANGGVVVDRVAPLAMEWHFDAKPQRWTPYVSAGRDRGGDWDPKKIDDSSHIWMGHKLNDADNRCRGTLGQVLLVPMDGPGYDKSEDGDLIKRTQIGIERAWHYLNGGAQGPLHQVGARPGPKNSGTILRPVEMYFWPSRFGGDDKWHWYALTNAGAPSKPPDTGEPSEPGPTTPTPRPNGGGGPVPTGGGAPAPGGGPSSPLPGTTTGGGGGGGPAEPWNDPNGRGGGTGYDPSNPWGLPGGGLGGRGSGSGVKHAGGTKAPRGAPSSGEVPIDPGGTTDPLGGTTEPGSSPSSPGYGPFALGGSGKDPYGWRSSPYSRKKGHYVPNHIVEQSYYSTPAASMAYTTTRTVDPSIYESGSPVQTQLTQLPPRASVYESGTPVLADQGLIDVSPSTVDWSETRTDGLKTSQDEFDNLRDDHERLHMVNTDNAILDLVTDSEALARSEYTERFTATIPAGSDSVAVATSYAYVGDVPEMSVTAVGPYVAWHDGGTGASGSARTFTVSISSTAPSGDVEVGGSITYAIPLSTAITADALVRA